MPLALPIELTPSQVRPVAYRVISKKHGLNLKSGALEVLAEFLGHHFGADWRSARAEKFLDEIARTWKEEDRGLFVDGAPLSQIIGDLLNAHTQTQESEENATPGKQVSTDTDNTKKFHWRDYFRVVNAQTQRRLVYKPNTKHFEHAGSSENENAVTGQVIGKPASLVQLFPTRFHLLNDKLHRNDLFDTPVQSNSSGGYGTTQIKNMLGRPNEEFFLFGLLVRPDGESGDLYIADTSGKIRLQLHASTSIAPDHYYTLGSFVICMGIYRVDYFEVSTIGPPVAETRAATQEAFGHIDFYGLMNGGRTSRVERIDRNIMRALVQEEQALPDHRIAILGCDVYLDQITVVDSLRKVLRKLAESPEPPIALIIPGSFMSVPFQTNNSTAKYRDAMNALAQLLQQEEKIAQYTKIIIVPGDNDPWHATFSAGATPLWPLQPIPPVFASRVNRSAADVVWASNPTRLLYLSQEIVIARDDYGKRFRRTSLKLDGSELFESRETQTDMEIDEPEEEQSESPLDDEERADRKKALNGILNDALQSSQSNKIDMASINAAEARKVVATLLDQCSLSPFPLSSRPIIWEYDQALSLAQWPSVLLLLDPSTPRFQHTYEGCAVLNPGPFLSDGTANWLEFWPGSGHYEVRGVSV